MDNLVIEAIREVTTATRRISEQSDRVSTHVVRDGDNFSFARPESGSESGVGLGKAIVQRLFKGVASK
jgi:hypothetical protein